MSEREKIIKEVIEVNEGIPSRDWRINRMALDLKNLEEERIKKNIESNGKDH